MQILMIFVFIVFFGQCSYAQNLFINLIAVYGTDVPKETPVKYYLPEELTPEDIITTGSLKIEYDIEHGAYAAIGNFTLNPKESRTFKIEVKDIWRVDPDEIVILKEQVNSNLRMLEDSEFYESGSILAKSMVKKLDYILERQSKFAANIERRIEEYRANIQSLSELKNNIFDTEYLSTDSPVPVGDRQELKLIVEAENPSSKEAKKVIYRHYLPKEVRAEHIVDSQGFDVRFDSKRNQAYLEKEEEFQPAEKKRYIILIKDSWHVPKPAINAIYARTRKAFDSIQEAEGFEDMKRSAELLSNKIFEAIKLIQGSQAEERNIKGYIGIYRVNKERYASANETLTQLERLRSIIAAKRLKELEDLDESKVTNVLEKIQALRGIAALSKALLGKRPSITATWRIIWGVLAFIALFTSLHFFTWHRRSKYMGEENVEESKGEIKEISDSSEEEKEEEKKKKEA